MESSVGRIEVLNTQNFITTNKRTQSDWGLRRIIGGIIENVNLNLETIELLAESPARALSSISQLHGPNYISAIVSLITAAVNKQNCKVRENKRKVHDP